MGKKYRAPKPSSDLEYGGTSSKQLNSDKQPNVWQSLTNQGPPPEDDEQEIMDIRKLSRMPSGGSSVPIQSFQRDFWVATSPAVTTRPATGPSAATLERTKKSLKSTTTTEHSREPRAKQTEENAQDQAEKKYPFVRRVVFRNISPAISTMVHKFEGKELKEPEEPQEKLSEQQFLAGEHKTKNPNLRTPALPLSRKSAHFVSQVTGTTVLPATPPRSSCFATTAISSTRPISPATANRVWNETAKEVSSIITNEMSKMKLHKPGKGPAPPPPTRVSSLRSGRYMPMSATPMSPENSARKPLTMADIRISSGIKHVGQSSKSDSPTASKQTATAAVNQGSNAVQQNGRYIKNDKGPTTAKRPFLQTKF